MSNIALDVFIGLVLIYLLYSLLLSIIGEIIANWLGLRARTLRLGITRMLCDADVKGLHIRSIIEVVKDWFLYQKEGFDETMAGRFYAHPTIKYLAKNQSKVGDISSIKTKPAYLTKDTFSTTLINMWRSSGKGIHDWAKIRFSIENNILNLDPETHMHVRHLLHDAEDDMEAFIERLEFWFDEMMDRVNGWYKRKIGFILFVLGLALSILFNVDTLQIVKTLSIDKKARDKMVEMAIAKVQTDPSDASKQALEAAYNAIQADIAEANTILGLGLDSSAHAASPNEDGSDLSFVGWLITALALSLGAPFWFDLLKKLMSIRSSGEKPDKDGKTKIRTKPKSPQNTNTRGKISVTGNAVDTALYKFKSTWEEIPGVIAVNKKNKNTVQITHLEGYNLPEINSTVSISIDGKSETVKIHKNVGKIALAHVHGSLWNPANNQGDIEDRGTISGVVKDRYTGRHALVTCGHVLSSTRTSKVSLREPKIMTSIAQNHKFTLRRVAWSNYADCGIALFDDQSVVSSYPIIPPVSSKEFITKGTEVLIHCRRFADPIKAEIIDVDVDYTFNYRQKFDYKSRELITIATPIQDGQFGSPSEPGDSGSLVTVKDDQQEWSIGILIGGVGDKTKGKSFVMPIQRVLDTLQIEIIQT